MTTTAIVLFGSFFIFLLLSVPVAFSLIISSSLALLTMDISSVSTVFTKMFAEANSWLLLAIPFFIMVGFIMEKGGVTERLVNFADAIVGFLPGGLSATNIMASLFFGGVSGSSIADTSANGTVLIPAMVRQGYGRRYSAAITASSSPLGIIIPPSIPMILWGFTAGISVADLFLAGIGAGILITIALLIVSTIISIKRDYRSSTSFSLKKVFQTGKEGMLALVAPIIIIGGIVTGFVTPTEAGVLATVYSLFLGFFIFKELNLKDLPEIILNTGKLTGTVMFIIAGAATFAHVLTLDQIPTRLANFVVNLNLTPTTLLISLVILFIIIGMFLDANAAVILIVPIIAPVIVQAGLDPYHASVVLITTLGIGLLTPPVGLCVYVAAGIAGIKFEDIMKDVTPFAITLFVCVLILVFFPQIIMTIPELLSS